MKHLAHAVILTLLGSAVAAAQDDQKRQGPPGTVEQPDPMRSREQRRAQQDVREAQQETATQQMDADGGVDVSGDGAGDGTIRHEVEGAAGERTIAANASSGSCGHMALLDPVRIPPSSTGEIVVVLTLMNSAVITPDAPFRIEYERRQEPITLADWRLQPARPGTLSTRYRGQPVYDNTATVRIPVQVDGATPHGKYPVDLKVEVPLTNGDNAAPLGVFRTSVRAEVVVGPPVPRPGVVVPVGGAASLGAGSSPAESAPTGGEAVASGQREAASEGGDGKPVAAWGPSDAVAPRDAEAKGSGVLPPETAPVGGSDPLPWIVLGGAAAALLVVVLLRMRGR